MQVDLSKANQALVQLQEALTPDADPIKLRFWYCRLYSFVPFHGYQFPEEWFDKQAYEEGALKRANAYNVPFLSEYMLYPLLGKEEARSVLSLINTFAEAAGISREEQWELRELANTYGSDYETMKNRLYERYDEEPPEFL